MENKKHINTSQAPTLKLGLSEQKAEVPKVDFRTPPPPPTKKQ